MLPRFAPVYLAFVVCAGVCAGQQAGPDSCSPSPFPQSPAANVGDAPIPGGLNGLQGAKVTQIQVSSPGIEQLEKLLPLLSQKANEPLDKYKVRQSVQALLGN